MVRTNWSELKIKDTESSLDESDCSPTRWTMDLC